LKTWIYFLVLLVVFSRELEIEINNYQKGELEIEFSIKLMIEF